VVRKPAVLYRKPAASKVASLAASPVQGCPRDLDEAGRGGDPLRTYASGENVLVSGQAGMAGYFSSSPARSAFWCPAERRPSANLFDGTGDEFRRDAAARQTTRSATVIADTEVTCRILEAGDFNRLSEQAPLLKITLLENLSKDMADKLRRATSGSQRWPELHFPILAQPGGKPWQRRLIGSPKQAAQGVVAGANV